MSIDDQLNNKKHLYFWERLSNGKSLWKRVEENIDPMFNEIPLQFSFQHSRASAVFHFWAGSMTPVE